MTRTRKMTEVMYCLKNRIDQVVLEEFPEGSMVYYMHGRHEREAEVLGHGSGRAIFVRGATGKEYRLDAWRIHDSA